jgi:putative transposase
VIDDFNREDLAIEVDFSLPASRVARALDQIIEWRGQPKRIRCDNGPEYISSLLATWAINKGIELMFIQPGIVIDLLATELTCYECVIFKLKKLHPNVWH